jgi:hypothetical protein
VSGSERRNHDNYGYNASKTFHKSSSRSRIGVGGCASRLRSNHFCLGLNLTVRIYLEELIRSILRPEINTILLLGLMVWPRTQPLLIDVFQHLFQIGLAFVTFHRLLS